MSDQDGVRPAPRRDDTGDHDLLTYGEAAVRLHEEIAAQRWRVAELERDGTGGEVDAARHRLAVLEAAAQRNRRQPINDSNFEEFFGYRGVPRRNT